MAKYDIIREYSDTDGSPIWKAYRRILGSNPRLITSSVKSAEQCEKNLRRVILRPDPKVIKTVIIND